MRIGMIWAEARGGAIGLDGDMPWHLPEDLAHFKQATLGAPVIMGRRTWESLPERFRPLPGRANFVVSRDEGYSAPGAEVRSSIEGALAASRDLGSESVWIMGGGALYAAAMPLAEELLVTRIELNVQDADTFAPIIDEGWELVDPGAPLVSKSGLEYRFERWTRSRQIP